MALSVADIEKLLYDIEREEQIRFKNREEQIRFKNEANYQYRTYKDRIMGAGKGAPVGQNDDEEFQPGYRDMIAEHYRHEQRMQILQTARLHVAHQIWLLREEMLMDMMERQA